ncbi:hypothetical protein ACMG4M_05195 [Alcanivorax sp. IL3]|uniref:hypothetical protein n=1 Tax=unclassified Alcanivorax TaxID=2638842 RepID=UPI0039C2D022
MKKALTIGISALLLSACANPLTRPESKVEPFSKPATGGIASASIGDTVISTGTHETFQAIDLSNKLAIKGQFEAIPGQYQIVAEAHNEFYAAPYSGAQTEARQGKIISLDSAYTGHLKLRIDKKTGRACAVQNLGTVLTNWCSDIPANYTRTTGRAMTARSENQTLIFLGINGDKAKFQYREFSGGYAQPIMETESVYDLSESKEITYKGATLEILEASNQRIKYKLISNFN